ncbi:hypothetical protein LTR85_003577 [Meristemomyces frigidus]|nr:hypothetical protein LTR85_003577 [Meristemomyces frigidus]
MASTEMVYLPATFESPPPPMPPIGQPDTRTASEKSLRHRYLAEKIVLAPAIQPTLFDYLPSAKALFALSYSFNIESGETTVLRDLVVSLFGGDVAKAYQSKFLSNYQDIHWLAPLDAYGLWCSEVDSEIESLAAEAVQNDVRSITAAISFHLIADGVFDQLNVKIETVTRILDRLDKESWLIRPGNSHLRLMLAELVNRNSMDPDEWRAKLPNIAAKGVRRTLTSPQHEDYEVDEGTTPREKLDLALYEDRLDHAFAEFQLLYRQCSDQAWREYLNVVHDGDAASLSENFRSYELAMADGSPSWLHSVGIDLHIKLRLDFKDSAVDALRIWMHLAAEHIWCKYMNKEWFMSKRRRRSSRASASSAGSRTSE